MNFILHPGEIVFSDLRTLLNESTIIELDPGCHEKIQAAQKTVAKVIDEKKVIYGINTGFGALANTRINESDLSLLQQSLVLSHATGTGQLLSDQAVRLILILKVNSLARGYSGVHLETITALLKLLNTHVYPCIPSQGSVGASGDLAPLAHLSCLLLGVGEARYQGKIISAKKALSICELKPLQLAPKEGLALLNGTQASTALALLGLLAIEDVFMSAIVAGALSIDAARGSDHPFDERIQAIRGHETQIHVAKILRQLLHGSEIRQSHYVCHKIQDPYSLRCQPQVMGACLSHILYAKNTLLTEANAVTDNPLIFTDDNEIISGGNFHGEPVGLAADVLAESIAEIAALSERRIALLIDPNFSGLPAFLVNQPGINSGFMMAQVTAAALVSENKALAFPVTVDSLPTSANQEDHTSMSMYASKRLLAMAENAAAIIGIELLAASQAIDLLRPLKTSIPLQKIHHMIREHVDFYEQDRYFAPDIERIKILLQSGKIREQINLSML